MPTWSRTWLFGEGGRLLWGLLVGVGRTYYTYTNKRTDLEDVLGVGEHEEGVVQRGAQVQDGQAQGKKQAAPKVVRRRAGLGGGGHKQDHPDHRGDEPQPVGQGVEDFLEDVVAVHAHFDAVGVAAALGMGGLCGWLVLGGIDTSAIIHSSSRVDRSIDVGAIHPIRWHRSVHRCMFCTNLEAVDGVKAQRVARDVEGPQRGVALEHGGDVAHALWLVGTHCGGSDNTARQREWYRMDTYIIITTRDGKRRTDLGGEVVAREGEGHD